MLIYGVCHISHRCASLLVRSPLDLDEEADVVAVGSHEEPTGHSHNGAQQHGAVIDVVEHVGEGHVARQQGVSAVDEDAVHAQRQKGMARPELPMVDEEVAEREPHEAASRRDEAEGRRPEVLVHRNQSCEARTRSAVSVRGSRPRPRPRPSYTSVLREAAEDAGQQEQWQRRGRPQTEALPAAREVQQNPACGATVTASTVGAVLAPVMRPR